MTPPKKEAEENYNGNGSVSVKIPRSTLWWLALVAVAPGTMSSLGQAAGVIPSVWPQETVNEILDRVKALEVDTTSIRFEQTRVSSEIREVMRRLESLEHFRDQYYTSGANRDNTRPHALENSP